MHDYFEILGLAPGAPAVVIRRASAKRGAAVHPDFRPAGDRPAETADPAAVADVRAGQAPPDAAVNFIDMSALVGRIEAAFFRSPR